MFVQLAEYPMYAVTEAGEVLSFYRNLEPIKPRVNRHGYAQVCLAKEGKHTTRLVHRLMAEAFLGKHALDINHENGIKSDNRLENLVYCTRSENIHHSYKLGLAQKPQGPNHKPRKSPSNFDGPANKRPKLDMEQSEQLMSLKGTMSYKKAGIIFGISATTVMKYWNPEV